VQLDDKVQVVVSMFPPSALGRSALTPRFTAVVRILSTDYPSIEDLGLIYTEYFRSLLRARKIEESISKQLSALMVDAYAQIRKNYSVD
jgi:dynein heavy chain 2